MSKVDRNSGVSAKLLGWFFTIIVGAISIVLFGSLFFLNNKFTSVQESTNKYMSWKQTALDVKDASDYLTDQVRYYVFNKQKIYMDNYFEEADVNKRRDKAIETIESYLPDSRAAEEVKQAVQRSRELMSDEFYAMRLVVESLHISMDSTYPDEVKNVALSAEDIALNDEAKQNLALKYVIGEKYLEDKEYITQKVNIAVTEIDTMMEKNVIVSTEDLKKIIVIQQILISLNIVALAGGIIFLFVAVYKPVNDSILRLRRGEKMEIKGVREYRYLASVYNEIKDQNDNVQDKLRYQAEHDQLTGLYNRTGYVSIYKNAKLEKCYFMLFDIDLFKSINDKFGHEIGDKVLIKVAKAITKEFNLPNEYVFRLGGDEFAALIVNEDGSITIDMLKQECERILANISNDDNLLPDVSVSIGIAKGDENDTTDTLFRKADKALYEVKKHGRHGYHVYGE